MIHVTQGYGTNFYSDDEYYEGEWYADKRSGWGQMYYADGSVYEGIGMAINEMAKAY